MCFFVIKKPLISSNGFQLAKEIQRFFINSAPSPEHALSTTVPQATSETPVGNSAYYNFIILFFSVKSYISA